MHNEKNLKKYNKTRNTVRFFLVPAEGCGPENEMKI